MSDLDFARSQMALSLAFHIVFAALGVALPLFMVLAEWRFLRTGERVWLELARRWAKGAAILFAVGAVSGTVLSFELGLLWPTFMEHAGPVVSMPFSLEGFAFFSEAIFLGIYLYGWEKLSTRAHLAAGAVVAASGIASASFVVTANAWMNTPTGFRMEAGRVVDVDPLAALLNPAALHEVLHMLLACYMASAFAAAGVHAWLLRRDRTSVLHRKALSLLLVVGGVTAALMPLSGDLAAKRVAVLQPAKLAAMEGHFHTMRGAPLHVGGWPDEEAMETRWAIALPAGLSFLAFADPDAEVRGLEEFPRDAWPPVAATHLAFQLMVGCGMALLGLSALLAFLAWRTRRLPDDPRLLLAIALAAPLGFVALEAGWTVTEVGRQPWVIYGVLRTADAVTPMPGLVVPFASFALVYALLAVAVVYLLRRQFTASLPGAPRDSLAPPPVTHGPAEQSTTEAADAR